MNHKNTLLAFLASLFLLAGCGGGGGGGSSSGNGGSEQTPPTDSSDPTDPSDPSDPTDPSEPTDPEPEPEPDYGAFNEGLLLDGATNGLSVEYPTGEVAIVEDGLIGFYEDAPSTLYLGASEIATVAGSEIVPFEGMTIAAGVNADYWTNVGLLLLTADSDGSAVNGIEVTEATRNVADGYALTFDVDSSTFLAANNSALEAIRATTTRSALPTVADAEAWVDGIRSTMADAFNAPEYLNFALFSEGYGFEGSVELYDDATGLLRLSNTGVFGSNFSKTDSQSPIVSWGSVNHPDYPNVLTGVKFSTDSLTLTCYPLKRDRMSYDAFCTDSATINRRFVLGDYVKPINQFYALETALNFGYLGANDLSVYGGRGNAFSGTYSDNTLKGQLVFEIGNGSYLNLGAGEWIATTDQFSGRRFIEVGSGQGVMTTIGNQLGLGAFQYSVTPIEENGSGGYTSTGQAESLIAVVTDLELTDQMLGDKTFTRYNSDTFAEIGAVTLEAGGTTTTAGVTWEIANGGDGLALNGDQFDRCTFAGEVVGDLFFYCDTSFEPGYGRFEHWVLSTNQR